MSHPVHFIYGSMQGIAVGCWRGGTRPWIRRGPFNGFFLFCRFKWQEHTHVDDVLGDMV